MTHNEIKKLLNGVFVPRAEGLDGVCFDDSYLHADSDTNKNAIYEAISEAQRKSDLTFNFSYTIAEKAIDILSECSDFDNLEDLHEQIDSAVPIYTHDIMQIYNSDSWIVDEACEELGTDGDSEQRAQTGWYIAIDRMVQAIGQNLANCYEFEEV